MNKPWPRLDRLGMAVRRIGTWAVQAGLGVALALGALEGILQTNPSLLMRGMALPAPVDPPITTREYDVYNTDADLFFWSGDLIRPIDTSARQVEAHVTYTTDEFGFPNVAPLPPTVDIVVLGRSYSMGAQAADPWPRQLERATGWRVLNLSQPGSGNDIKQGYWTRYAAPRHPRWVIVEVMPTMDILDYDPAPPLMLSSLPAPLIQHFAWQKGFSTSPEQAQIYPLRLDLPNRQAELSFFFHYLSALTADRDAILASERWAGYKQSLAQLIAAVRARSTCVALLYVPTKEDIYFPLAVQPEQLKPTLASLRPLHLNTALPKQDQDLIAAMQKNASLPRDLVGTLAQEHGVLFLDPSERMTQLALSGPDPFMSYDTHWSAAGHRSVSELVAETLQHSKCTRP